MKKNMAHFTLPNRTISNSTTLHLGGINSGHEASILADTLQLHKKTQGLIFPSLRQIDYLKFNK